MNSNLKLLSALIDLDGANPMLAKIAATIDLSETKTDKSLPNKIKFPGSILWIGYGIVSRCTLPLISEHLDFDWKKVTIVDKEDKKKELKAFIDKGATFVLEEVTEESYEKQFKKYVGKKGDMIVDLAYNIGVIDIVTWCHENEVFYFNTSVEEWDPYQYKTIYEKTLYNRHMKLRKAIKSWSETSTTAILDHGANPGIISHLTKKGLLDLAKAILNDTKVLPSQVDKQKVRKAIKDGAFNELAMHLGVKTIHDSERDTQISLNPKRVNEFVGTWSIEGLREEGTLCSEIGWGTHEIKVPEFAQTPSEGPKHQIFLAQMGINTLVRSFVPGDGEIVGMAIRHGESLTIPEALTVYNDKGKAIYRPTFHYAYMPCDGTVASLLELKARNYEIQDETRPLFDDIISGDDCLGALIMGHPYNSWYCGSRVNINESRKIVPGQNATSLQVAAGVISGIMWMIQNPNEGVCFPDNLPCEEILEFAKPYLGEVISERCDWTPFTNYKPAFEENEDMRLDAKNPWCFQNFIFK